MVGVKDGGNVEPRAEGVCYESGRVTGRFGTRTERVWGSDARRARAAKASAPRQWAARRERRRGECYVKVSVNSTGTESTYGRFGSMRGGTRGISMMNVEGTSKVHARSWRAWTGTKREGEGDDVVRRVHVVLNDGAYHLEKQPDGTQSCVVKRAPTKKTFDLHYCRLLEGRSLYANPDQAFTNSACTIATTSHDCHSSVNSEGVLFVA